MAVEHNLRSNFVFAPPPDDPTAWQASTESFGHALTRDFPEAFLEINASALRDVPVVVLDFEIEVEPDHFVAGTAAMPAPDYAHVSIVDVTAHAAALFARWLRDSYVLAGQCAFPEQLRHGKRRRDALVPPGDG